MAVAELQSKAETDIIQGGWRHTYHFAFYGADVPGTLDYADISIDTNAGTVLSTVPSLIAAAVRALATSRGYTVPANKVLMPTYGVA